MADEIQKISFDVTRALVNANSIAREPSLNTGAGDTPAHPELIIKNDGGTPVYFPSEVKLASVVDGASGGDLIGVSDDNFTLLTQTTAQGLFEEIDTTLLTAINAVTPSLSDVSGLSTTTAQQTFTVKPLTTFKITGGSGGSDYINIQQNGTVTLWSDSDLIFQPTGKIYISGTEVHIVDRWIYLHGDSSTNGSWRYGYSGGNIVTEYRASGTWTAKQTITP